MGSESITNISEGTAFLLQGLTYNETLQFENKRIAYNITPKRVVVSRLHVTVPRFLTGVKFSPPYKNRGDSRRHSFVVVSCKQI